jgi:hypothetical protein
VRTDSTLASSRWLASTSHDARLAGGTSCSYWYRDRDVADWEVVYRPPAPPKPVGTVLRREGTLHGGPPFWEVAVRTTEGWLVAGQNYKLARADDLEPFDDDEGSWEVIHDPGN